MELAFAHDMQHDYDQHSKDQAAKGQLKIRVIDETMLCSILSNMGITCTEAIL